jgi:Zn-dependent protease with chaperone function
MARKIIMVSLATMLLLLAGCAEVTGPRVTDQELEKTQLEAARHPHLTWSMERVSRVFIKLLGVLPQVHGRTYPFLGFDWWVTATGKAAVDNVWNPSPAHDVGLKQGDVILAVNNWPLPTWEAEWDEYIEGARDIFHGLLFASRPSMSSKSRYRATSYHRTTAQRRAAARRQSLGAQSPSQRIISKFMPGEILAAIMLDMKHIGLEAQGHYLKGPVELLVQREEKEFTLTIYPQRLPAEYGILINSQDRKINAYAAPGQIILSQRLVNFCLNDDELAIVIGHELAHQALGHLVRSAGQQELGGLVGEAVTAFTSLSLNHLLNWRHYLVNADVRAVSQDAVVSVFSQDDEREADIYGAWYAFQAGYNVEKGVEIWERVAAVDEKDPFLSTYWLDSHPAPLERLTVLKKVARDFETGRAAQVFLAANQ